MTPAKPFTPDILAERWACSSETVRQLVKKGALRGFRVGRMIRIPRDAVEEYECQILASDVSEVDSVSTGETQRESEDVISLRHAPERKRNRKA